MTPTPNKSLIAILFAFASIFSCNQRAEVSFPESKFGYEFPETKPFQMPEPKSFEWKEIHPDSVVVSKVSFDMDKLPSIPFSLNEFKPLKKPMDVQPLDWENLPEISLNLDTITSIPLVVKHSILPEPTVSEIIESIAPNTTSGSINMMLEKGNYGLTTAGLILDDQNFVWQANRKNLIKVIGNRFFSYPIVSEISTDLIIKLNRDQNGNLWISTLGKGVFRVNTKTQIITNYNLPGDFPNFIYNVESDENGLLWMSSIGDAVYILDPEAETIKRLPIQELEGNSGNAAISIKKDKQNNLWISNRSDISVISPDRKSFKKIKKEQGLLDGIKTGFFEDSAGNMWIESIESQGAQVISTAQKTISTLGKEQGFDGNGILYAEDQLNRIWIHDNNYSYVIDLQKNSQKRLQTNSSLVNGPVTNASLTDSRGNVWLGTNNGGLFLYDPLGPLPEFFTANNGFDGNEFWGTFEDNRGRIWIMTHSKIHIYDPFKNELKFLGTEHGIRKPSGIFRHIFYLRNNQVLITSEAGFSLINLDENSITNVNVKPSRLNLASYGSMDQNGNLWIGTNSGLVWYNSSFDSVKWLDQSSGLSFNIVSATLPGKDSKIYVATYDKLNILDPIENKIWHIGKEEGMASSDLLTIVPSQNGGFWIPTMEGISIFDQDFKTLTNITSRNGLIPEDVYDLLESDEYFYAGSSDGLIQIPKKQFMENEGSNHQSFQLYNYAKGFGYPYTDHNQKSGSFLKSGMALYGVTPLLAVATQEPIPNSISPEVFITGLDIMDQKTSFKRLSDIVSNVKPGDTLWNADGKVFYFSDSPVASDDYLTQNKIHWDSISPTFNLPIGLTLPHDQNALQFYFDNPESKSRGSILYSYVLEGYEDSWSNPLPDAKSKSYFNLSPGAYTLKVVTKGFNGIWSEPASLKFTILPPWWLTWWGYLLFAVIFSGIVWAIVQVRSNMLKKENRILEEKVKLRTSQLEKSLNDLKSTQAQLIQSEKMASLGELTAGIAHEIQNPLNFVNNFSEVSAELLMEMEAELDQGDLAEAKSLSRDIRENLHKISHHGRRADSIVKGMLQHSRGTTGETKPTNINAMAEEYLRLSYQGFRARDKDFQADFITELDPDLPRVNVVRQDMGRVLLNLINNAFYACAERSRSACAERSRSAFAERSQTVLSNQDNESSSKSNGEAYKPLVTLKTKIQDGYILISVSDNGNGISPDIKDKIFQPFFTTKPAGQGTGLGLSMSYDIIKAHGGELKVESREGEGSEFMVLIPT
ncbi:sensor histidine kinase [Pararhodonellum marinum]|uniref:sensor histidine kinase n=1 Tax=Pararhodonellum marinum TaxID=2755358 RepID=UPI00188EB8C9|nr:sensor histidine kinase [Pararhodonellum marinum]